MRSFVIESLESFSNPEVLPGGMMEKKSFEALQKSGRILLLFFLLNGRSRIFLRRAMLTQFQTCVQDPLI
jgi:hypothetical protein